MLSISVGKCVLEERSLLLPSQCYLNDIMGGNIFAELLELIRRSVIGIDCGKLL